MARVPIAVVNTLQQTAHPLSVGKEQSLSWLFGPFGPFSESCNAKKGRTYMQRKDRRTEGLFFTPYYRRYKKAH